MFLVHIMFFITLVFGWFFSSVSFFLYFLLVFRALLETRDNCFRIEAERLCDIFSKNSSSQIKTLELLFVKHLKIFYCCNSSVLCEIAEVYSYNKTDLCLTFSVATLRTWNRSYKEIPESVFYVLIVLQTLIFIFFSPSPFPRVTFHGMSGSFGCMWWEVLFSGQWLYTTSSSGFLGEKSPGKTLSTTTFLKDW